ncbi:flagellar biosynthetic protein FliO [Halobacillus sp. BBL2006]|uniref:flagellar biosynthetic protein FliO n=1 Tax=Halobacillus sp. BBL2006 TaxID=1543706 RepID=UPI000542F7CD|nr:flagellar biosynthetic protein FliO [Halobacillus sp. BBL2006]KHE71979.1 hypothetical protein LD39_06985 [Halobacillus sp. BBL2006]
MIRATRITALAVTLLSLFLWSSQTVTLASPSATECFKNPELQGCPTPDSESDSLGSPVDPENEDAVESTPSLLWNIIKLIFALFFILALIYGLLKFFNNRNIVFSKNRTMENLGGMNLAPNRSIQAVRVGKQVFILGVGESIELITEVTDRETKDALVKQEDQQGMDTAFGFEKWIDKFKKTKNSSTPPSNVQFQQLFETQLKDMKNKRQRLTKQQEDRGDE